MAQLMNRLYIIHVIVITKYQTLLIFRGRRRVINQCLSVYCLSFRNSMIQFKNSPMNCGVPLLVAKMSSINDVDSLWILARLAPSPSRIRIFEKKSVILVCRSLAIHLNHYSSQQT